ncbi:hypothetical protein AB6A40_010721 [Gnathostoma spinigerum]|uniref:Bromodomain associated domain-containing protein n=1 Tax=Gnathostoma spinigerum TaxID=75299 RepID=A0ABD6EY44_9BILA
MTSLRSLDYAEDYAQSLIKQGTARIMENIGFSCSTESAFNIVCDLTQKFMERLWRISSQYAEHGGRSSPNTQDVDKTFKELQFSTAELHDYLKQVGSHPLPAKVPEFPVKRSAFKMLNSAVSEKELSERPDFIPHFLPPMHPEWCADRVPKVEPIATEASSKHLANSSLLADRRITRPVKGISEFPDFMGETAKNLGLVRRKRQPIEVVMAKMHAEPSGISSSANICSSIQNNSHSSLHTSKSKAKKPLVHETVTSQPRTLSTPEMPKNIPSTSVKKEELPEKSEPVFEVDEEPVIYIGHLRVEEFFES